MALYHADIYLPPVKLPNGQFSLTYGNHAKQQSLCDRYGIISLHAYIDTRRAKIIEIEVENNFVVKIVYRQPLDAQRDIIIVVNPDPRRSWFVRTVWVNLRSDNHKTLQEWRYAKR